MKLIPAVYFTTRYARMRRGEVPTLQTIFDSWQRDPRSRTAELSLAAEMLRRSMQIEYNRVHNDGHFARLIDIDGSVTIALPAMLAWARERFESMEYTIDDYFKAFGGDLARAERAYLQALWH